MTEPSQANTQLVGHLRSKGASSKLTGAEEEDILCFLHPASSSAIQAAELVIKTSPQFIHRHHQNTDGSFEEAYSIEPNTQSQYSALDHSNDSPPPFPGSRFGPPDIALRISANVRDQLNGFVFGRIPQKCDIVLAEKTMMMMSSVHFRIFVNEHGVLMLEDMSTNGTMVDGRLLRASHQKAKNGRPQTVNSLSNGSMVELPIVTDTNKEWMRFIVLVPQRNQGQEKYEENLLVYVECVKQLRRRAEVAMRGGCPIPPSQPVSSIPFLLLPLAKSNRDQDALHATPTP